ncbi:MAG: CHAP domain-containing protein [Clostridiales bacterium]|nr:CHAP domain-containing protein [Clostridiales bacterium]
MKHVFALCLAFLLLLSAAGAEENRLPPVETVPDYVQWLLEVAGEEVGYREGEHGWNKYGAWSGDPYAQWCAEFLCWCVDQVDQRHGTHLLNRLYPLYSGQNTGRAWFIRAGRFIVRKGEVEGWGYEWLKGHSSFIRTGDYIPQPGDYVFFTWTSGTDTDHVALVEYCAQDTEGRTMIHVIEGNNPVSVARNVYSLYDTQILGYGTVHDLADITMRYGNSGEKVRQLQESLAYLGFLESRFVTGDFGNATAAAVRSFQNAHRLRGHSIANMETQRVLQEEVELKRDRDPDTWTVVDEDE